MLSRRSSNASSRVRRSKSSASVNNSLSGVAPLDPEDAHQHAVAAASAAFERSGQHELAGRSRRNSVSSQQSEYRTGNRAGISRQRSVRFAGPNAVPRRRLTRFSEESPARYSAARHAVQHTGSLTDHHDFGSAGLAVLDRKLARESVLQEDVTYTPQDHIASAPSSYRRIRKAKSLSIQRNPAFGDAGADATSKGHRWMDRPLKVARSISFLRGSDRGVGSQPIEAQSMNTPTASLSFLQESRNGDAQYKGEPSSMIAPTTPLRHKSLRRTVRTSMESKYGPAISSPNQHALPLKRGLSSKARSFSLTVKDKLKRVFHRSSTRKSEVPVQQLQASRPHWQEYGNSTAGTQDSLDETSVPQKSAFSETITTGEFPMRTVSPIMELRSQADSPCSFIMENESNEKSRVTSWADSTVANTRITSQADGANHLSVIDETGDNSRPPLSRQPSRPARYTALRGPRAGTNASTMLGSNPVNNRGGYSDLLKILEGLSPGAKETEAKMPAESGDAGHQVTSSIVPPRVSSMESQFTSTTIKRSSMASGNRFSLADDAFPRLEHVSEDMLASSRWSECDSQILQKLRTEAASPTADETHPQLGSKSPDFSADPTVSSGTQTLYQAAKPITPDDVPATTVVTEKEPGKDDVLCANDTVPGQASPADSGSVYSRPAGSPRIFRSTTSLDPSGLNHPDPLAKYLGYTPCRPLSASSVGGEHDQLAATEEWEALARLQALRAGFSPAEEGSVLPASVTLQGRHRRERGEIDTDVDADTSLARALPAIGLGQDKLRQDSAEGRGEQRTVPATEIRKAERSVVDLSYLRQETPVQSAWQRRPSGAENIKPALSTGDLAAAAAAESLPRVGNAPLPLPTVTEDEASPVRITPRQAQDDDVFQDAPGAGAAAPPVRKVLAALATAANAKRRYGPERARRLAAYQRGATKPRKGDDGSAGPAPSHGSAAAAASGASGSAAAAAAANAEPARLGWSSFRRKKENIPADVGASRFSARDVLPLAQSSIVGGSDAATLSVSQESVGPAFI